MKAVVIAVMSIPESVQAAKRCVASAAKFGVHFEIVPAVTPVDDPIGMMRARGWPTEKFLNNRFSRPLPCISCFLSHAEAWHACAYSGESYLVAEHDALMVRPLPELRLAGPLVNLGAPSFGGFRVPPHGIGPLFSKPFLPGAHAYFLTNAAAVQLLAKAKTEAEPTDVFLSLRRFRFIKESFPYSFECHDEFSTVQAEEGCKGKHRKVRPV